MNDYKELIDDLRNLANFLSFPCVKGSASYTIYDIETIRKAAEIIAQLAKTSNETKEIARLAEEYIWELKQRYEKDKNKQMEDYREMRRQRDKAIKERDTAIADLTNIVHDMGNTCICDYCIGCVSNGFREGCKTDDGDRWEWRGVKEVEHDND